jgi:outer membrane protein
VAGDDDNSQCINPELSMPSLRLNLRLKPRLRLLRRPANLRRLIARRVKISTLLHLLLAPSVALAAEPAATAADAPSRSSWGLGVAASSTQKAYAGIDRDNTAIPLVLFENRWVRVLGPGLEVKLPSIDISASQKVDFRLLARYDPNGYEPDDAPILAGMEERKGGVWVGGKVAWRNEIADLSADAVTDASGYSNGQRVTLGVERTIRLGQQVLLAPRASASWLNGKYVDYYYGVRDNEAAAGRPAYLGESAINAELGARATYLFDRSHSIFLDAGVTRLGSEIKDSPLVDRSTVNRVSLGYLYRL